MSIFKRKDNGKWRVQISYKDNDGKYKRISRDVKTRKEAIALESSIQSKIGESSNPNITVNQICDYFLDTAGKEIRKTTIAVYEKTFRLYIRPYFGNIPFRSISMIEIDSWKRKIEKKGFTKVYLNDIFNALKKIFHVAEKDFNLSNNSLIKSGGFKQDPNNLETEDKIHFWNQEEFKKWMETISHRIEVTTDRKSKYTLISVKIYIAIMMLAGLRKGEANALLVSDFHDGNFPYLTVNKSLCEKIKGIPYLVTKPKTKKSIRDVPVPNYLSYLIRSHIDFLSKIPHYNSNSFFLCGGIRPIPDTTATYIKNAIEKESGVPHIRIHDLRHSYVSLLINAGTNVTVISNLVGHSTTDITMKVYSHLYPKTKNIAVSKLDEIIDGKEKK